jgi:HD superfamily phosphodiesterase
MEAVRLTPDDIVEMTLQVGEQWAIAHAKRLIELIKQIGADIPYDVHVMELAAYMHDWGAFPRYSQKT